MTAKFEEALKKVVADASAHNSLVPENFIAAKTKEKLLNTVVDARSHALTAFEKHRGPMNLLPDNIRLSPEYREAKASFDRAFSVMRNFNKVFVKKFAKELKAARRARFSGQAPSA